MELHRVVITGLGAVSPLGLNMPATWDGLIAGRSGISRVEYINPDVKIFGMIHDFEPEAYMDRKTAGRMDRFAQLAVASADEAIRDSGLDGLLRMNPEFGNDVGAMIGTGNGGQRTNEEEHSALLDKGPGQVSAFAVPKIMGNAGGGNISILYGLHGPSPGAFSACASGLDTIIFAYKAVRDGDVVAMLAGASEAALTPMVVAGFANMRALTKDYNDNPPAGSRPFDRDRSGFVFAEGAAVMVLESLEHALQRGAPIYAEVTGYFQNTDGRHITQPDPANQARAMRMALRKAGLLPDDVDYINAHGTSTPQNDKAETAAIKQALGEHAYKVRISSTKSMTGHLAGAAGALEAAATAMVVKEGFVPPTINLDNPDFGSGCDLDYTPHAGVRADVNVAMKNSFGFGGHNSVLVLRRYES